jgi:hypothetical protein
LEKYVSLQVGGIFLKPLKDILYELGILESSGFFTC